MSLPTHNPRVRLSPLNIRCVFTDSSPLCANTGGVIRLLPSRDPWAMTAVAEDRKVSSTMVLLGLRYTSLTFGIKRSIEKTIQLELGADSVTATYEADSRRQRGRRLIPGDTVVKWEAVFDSAATAYDVRRGDPQAFERRLTTRLNSNDDFGGVVAKSGPLAVAGLSSPAHCPRHLPFP